MYEVLCESLYTVESENRKYFTCNMCAGILVGCPTFFGLIMIGGGGGGGVTPATRFSMVTWGFSGLSNMRHESLKYSDIAHSNFLKSSG